MYLGVILVCGITGLNPMVEQGCAPMTSPKVYATEEECQKSLQMGMDQVTMRAGGDVFISDAQCVALNSSV